MDFISPFFTGSDNIIKTAIIVSAVSIILSLVLALAIVAIRVKLFFRHKKTEQVKQFWNPILAKYVVGEDTPIPVLHRSEYYAFLIEWNIFFSIVRGDSITKLKYLAHKMRLNEHARRILHSKKLHDKLLGAITLGHMREYAAWDELLPLVHHKMSIVAITAIRSLLLLDPKQGINTVLPMLVTQQQWPWASVAHALKLAGPNTVCESLSEISQRADPANQIQLLRYMDVVNCDIVTDGITNILQSTTNTNVASVCLHIVQDVKARETVRSYINHPVWYLRMHAARALGKIGNDEDVPRLLELLNDSAWWVRYRAAQAIALLAANNKSYLTQLKNQVEDDFGRDMLTQVIAEIRED